VGKVLIFIGMWVKAWTSGEQKHLRRTKMPEIKSVQPLSQNQSFSPCLRDEAKDKPKQDQDEQEALWHRSLEFFETMNEQGVKI